MKHINFDLDRFLEFLYSVFIFINLTKMLDDIV